MTATEIANTLYAAYLAKEDGNEAYGCDIYAEAMPFLTDDNRKQVQIVLERIYKCPLVVTSNNA